MITGLDSRIFTHLSYFRDFPKMAIFVKILTNRVKGEFVKIQESTLVIKFDILPKITF